MKYLLGICLVLLMNAVVANSELQQSESPEQVLDLEAYDQQSMKDMEGTPCDQLFYQSAAACDLEGFMETNDVVTCIAFKLQDSPCELEISGMDEVNVCGDGCAPNWLTNVEDSFDKTSSE